MYEVLSEVAAKSRAASKYANCYQKASVQLYAIEFKQLASLLQIPDVTAIAQFTKGLKQHVREGLIVNAEDGDVDAIITESIRLDSSMYASRRTSGYRKGGRGSHSGGGTTGKCHTCGQFGHRAAQCKVKAEKAPWN